MSEPVGWQWIEAWGNGTISDEEFASLRKLLHEEPKARQTLRRYMALDTALRDRAEARAFMVASEPAAELSLAGSPQETRSKFVWREVIAWSVAAACLLVAAFLWISRPTPNSSLPTIVDSESPVGPTVIDNPGAARVTVTLAQQREQLLASAPDVLHIQLQSDNSGTDANKSGGDIVWSSDQQIGYLRLQGFVTDDPAQSRYQLWIVGSDASGNEIINGGMFHLDRMNGELILPIQADQFVQQPKMFVVSVEPLGGGSALAESLLASADGIAP